MCTKKNIFIKVITFGQVDTDEFALTNIDASGGI